MMTNWERISIAVKGLFDVVAKEEFAESIANSSHACKYCNLQERCNKRFYKHDENGETIKDEDGDNVVDDDFPGCEVIILEYLDEEIKEEKE